jgi:NADH:ubiquinone oxidoreductase subunit 5 (subunit L)/multisubunit Na+/H+ antiporter MnhA subunit
VYLLLLGAILAPVLAGLCLLVVGQRLSASLRRGVSLAVLLLAAGCALGLLRYAGQDPGIAIDWLPGTGSMTLDLGHSSLYVLLATYWAACLALLGGWVGARQGTHYTDALTFVGLAAAGMALLSGHFLLRYVALEIVALCVAFALLAELGDEQGVRQTFLVYVLLRVGDAGLLGAIVALWGTLRTLDIGPALAATAQLPLPVLQVTAAGFLLAVWVKVGAWPFHLWRRAGRRLAPHSEAWLYATVFPNLGLYLLYRVVPLLTRAGPLGLAVLWLGAGGAVLAALLALRQRSRGEGVVLPYVDAVLGSLAVVAATGGLQAVVWLSVLVLTPIRLLLHLAVRAPRSDPARPLGVALGALGMGGWALCLTYWARGAGLPSAALHLAEAGVALLGVWVVLTVRQALAVLRAARVAARPLRLREEGHWVRWAGMGLLGLAGVALPWMLDPLSALYRTYSGTHLMLPAPLSLLRYVGTMPAAWAVAALAIAFELWGKGLLSRLTARTAADAASPQVREVWLRRIPLVLRRTIEGGILENGLGEGVQAILRISSLIYRYIEQGMLENALAQGVRAVVRGSNFIYRHIEQATLEGALRRAVQAVVGLARIGQRWHTGRLRWNLLWIVASILLALAIVLLVR